ncbi:hypothetical protein EYZ11_003617 [Aspergillus tanneri]|uniref:Uncharacterized protein n=1 Tax=Aspergillus tanneri TaxID=1220188 RepID=A0A4S3JN88_9EURO|nr:uncharacterized protein ATNIH1004_006546 [Aspergillus tanneri]KAA8647844.1 hypothetical protein ATNIH1004_006546 [Aspergillus tanneri]THC96900.1 hypothetical protein EYZ11_003617 [Aspergillus tanneri]
MEGEDLDTPFYFIVTGKYCDIYYDNNDFQLQTDSIFVVTTTRMYFTSVAKRFFSNEGSWTERVEGALHVQIYPLSKFEVEPSSNQAPPTISGPVVNPQHPISADDVDL